MHRQLVGVQWTSPIDGRSEPTRPVRRMPVQVRPLVSSLGPAPRH